MMYEEMFWQTFNNSREGSNEQREDTWNKTRGSLLAAEKRRKDLTDATIILKGELYSH